MNQYSKYQCVLFSCIIIISITEKYFNATDREEDYKYKYDCILYLVDDKIDGAKLVDIGQKQFGINVVKFFKIKKLAGTANRLYTAICKSDINCGPLKRIGMILNHFHQMTDNVKYLLYICFLRN